MQIFWAFLPLFAFFASFRFAGIYFATGVLIVTALLQLIVHRLRTGKYQTLHFLVAGLAVVLGGATLLLHDQRFIQWKATVLFWVLALVFLGSQFVGARTLVERLFQTTADLQFNVERRHWRSLNLVWVVFYALLGALNLYVAYHFRLETWVNFKFYGLTALMLLFILPQAVWIASRAEPNTPAAPSSPSKESLERLDQSKPPPQDS
jgi:intracellular septation protein